MVDDGKFEAAAPVNVGYVVNSSSGGSDTRQTRASIFRVLNLCACFWMFGCFLYR